MAAKGLFVKLWTDAMTDSRTSPPNLPPLAWCLWTRCMAISKANGNDGEVTTADAYFAGYGEPKKKIAAAIALLISSELWEKTSNGFRIPAHKWADRQQTKEQADEMREAKKKAADARWGKKKAESDHVQDDAGAMQPACTDDAAAMQTACRVRVRDRDRVREQPEETSSLLAPTETAHTVSDRSRTRPKSPPADSIGWTADGGWTGIDDQHRAKWAAAYPACDLDRQLAAMSAWLEANPAKAHKSRWSKFIVSWLTKSQDRGGDMASKTASNGTANGKFRPIGAGLSDEERQARTEKLKATARIT